MLEKIVIRTKNYMRIETFWKSVKMYLKKNIFKPSKSYSELADPPSYFYMWNEFTSLPTCNIKL